MTGWYRVGPTPITVDRWHAESARMQSFRLRLYAAHAYRHEANKVYTAHRSTHREKPSLQLTECLPAVYGYYSNGRHGQPACGQLV